MTEAFSSVELQEPPETNGAEEPPKRGRGRPRKNPGETAPRKPRVSRASLHSRIVSLLMTLNLATYVIPPLRADALDMIELNALASALEEQAKQSTRFRNALEGALAATSGGALLGVLAIIGARRAARHNLIPGGVDLDRELGNMLANAQNMPRPVEDVPEPSA